MIDLTRLQTTLGSNDLRWLVQRVRTRLENGGKIQGVVVLRSPTSEQRAAVDRLFGRRPTTGSTLTVDLSKLDQLVQHAEIADGLPAAVEALTGPLENLKEQRTRVDSEWAQLFSDMDTNAHSNPVVVDYVRNLRTTGLLRRLSRQDIAVAHRLLSDVLAINQRLPAESLPIAELAATVTGDSHALDQGKPLATLSVRLAANLGGTKSWDTSQERRDAWASVGVLCDELSASVLTLNLLGDNLTLTGQTLQLHAAAGEPYRITIRQLLHHPARFRLETTGNTVYVCENPTVVAAVANRLGPQSSPLVCTEGQPNNAVQLLLRQLISAGVQLAYHGDFDWGGIQIGNYVMQKIGAIPWRFSADDYATQGGGNVLQGNPVPAFWDTRLMGVMKEQGRAIHEEQVLDDLLKDVKRT